VLAIAPSVPIPKGFLSLTIKKAPQKMNETARLIVPRKEGNSILYQ
jgi:hypothetical protein